MDSIWTLISSIIEFVEKLLKNNEDPGIMVVIVAISMFWTIIIIGGLAYRAYLLIKKLILKTYGIFSSKGD